MFPLGKKAALGAGMSCLLLGAVVADAPAGTPAIDAAGNYIDLDVNVFPPKAKKGGSIEYHSFSGNRVNPGGVMPSSDIKVAFPKGFAFHSAPFPKCTLNTAEFSSCPDDALIGTGTAEGAVKAADGSLTYVPVDLKGYNGAPVDGKPTLIFLGQSNGSTVAELDFTIESAGNGPLLDDIVDPSAEPSPIFITQFNLTTKSLHKGKGRKRVNFLDTAKKCPKRGWKFTQTNTNANGSLAATSYSPCTK